MKGDLLEDFGSRALSTLTPELKAEVRESDIPISKTFEVALSVAPDHAASLGIKVDHENVVSSIKPGSALALDGRMRVGDKVLSLSLSQGHTSSPSVELGHNGPTLAEALRCVQDACKDSATVGAPLVYRFHLTHVIDAGSTAEKLQALVLQEKARRKEKELAAEQAKVAKRAAAAAAREAAERTIASDAASGLRAALKASSYKLPELERLLERLHGLEGTRVEGGRRTETRREGSPARARSAGSGRRPPAAAERAAATKEAEVVAEDAPPAASAAGEPTTHGEAADQAIFVHFIPPPLRASGKSDLAWIVHTCSGGCREAKHVSFHSITGFSTYEGEPPEKAEGLCCSCTIANHHLRGFGRVRWEGDHAIVEDEGCASNVNGRAYKQQAEKLAEQVKTLQAAERGLRQRLQSK